MAQEKTNPTENTGSTRNMSRRGARRARGAERERLGRGSPPSDPSEAPESGTVRQDPRSSEISRPGDFSGES